MQSHRPRTGADTSSPVPVRPQQASPITAARPLSLPIGIWLVLGFALVIGAFAAASAVALRSTRHATVDLAHMQRQFEPLSRSVRDLGDGLAAFDRAILAYLRADTRDNRAAAVAAAERLSHAANDVIEVDAARDSLPVNTVMRQIAEHEAAGMRLLELQDQRRRAISSLEAAFGALDRRVKSAGGSGIVVSFTLPGTVT